MKPCSTAPARCPAIAGLARSQAMSPRSVARGIAPVIMTALAGIASAIPASAQDIPGYPSNFDAYDPREMAMLPPFCTYTMLIRDKVPGGSDSAKVEAWKNLLGP